MLKQSFRFLLITLIYAQIAWSSTLWAGTKPGICLDVFQKVSEPPAPALRLDRDFQFAPKVVPEFASDTLGGKVDVLPIDQIHFMQLGIANISGEYTVTGNAKAIKEGTLDPAVLPPAKIWRDTTGRIWTLDHRRVAAQILSGKVENIRVVWATREEVEAQQFKFSSIDQGHSMLLTDEKSSFDVIRKPGPKTVFTEAYSYQNVALKIQGKLASQNVPVLRGTVAPIKPVEWKSSGKPKLVAINEILFSDFVLKGTRAEGDPEVLALAKEILTGQMTITTLPPLKVFVDRKNRIWTLDNVQLAAYRLAGVEKKVRAQVMEPNDIVTAEHNLRSLTGGSSILVQSDNPDFVLIVMR